MASPVTLSCALLADSLAESAVSLALPRTLLASCRGKTHTLYQDLTSDVQQHPAAILAGCAGQQGAVKVHILHCCQRVCMNRDSCGMRTAQCHHSSGFKAANASCSSGIPVQGYQVLSAGCQPRCSLLSAHCLQRCWQPLQWPGQPALCPSSHCRPAKPHTFMSAYLQARHAYGCCCGNPP